MFQRLKGAFDSIAEEQTRQRLSPRHATNGPSRGASVPSPGRTSQFGHETEGISDQMAGPDPDPNTFDPDKVMSDGSSANINPKSESHQKASVSQTSSNHPEGSSTEIASTGNPSAKRTHESAEASSELAVDVESKLRRLHKLESKYQELLRAYRRAHARNSSIEPFEACLRESTPLTSINDPNALSEFVNQLNMKSQMAVDELKRVAKENEDNKKRLEELEGKTEEASDEALQLKQRSEETGASSPSRESGMQEIQIFNNGGSANSPTTSTRIKQKAAASLTTSTSEDMFSIDDEIPRLQEELHEQGIIVTRLEKENALLQKNLSVAEESTEHMMHDLERAKLEIHSYSEKLHTERSQLTEMETRFDKLNSEIADYQSKITFKESLILQQDKLLAELRNEKSEQSVDTEKEPHVHDESCISSKYQLQCASAVMNEGPKTETGLSRQHLSFIKLANPNDRENEQARDNSSESTQLGDNNYSRLLQERDRSIQQLETKLRDQVELTEEIEVLRDELISVGQEHVEAREQIRLLRDENQKLQGELSMDENSVSINPSRDDAVDLDGSWNEQNIKAVEDMGQDSQSNNKQYRKLSQELTELDLKCKSAEVELRAAQKLAASRYKEVTQTRQLLQKVQSELALAKIELKEAKSSRDELSNSNKELKRLESQDEFLKLELSSLRQDIIAKDTEIRKSNQRLEQETSQRASSEETARKYQTEVQKTMLEKQEILDAKEIAFRNLTRSNKELEQLRGKVKSLGQEVKELSHETEVLRDALSIKTAQHASAETLMGNVRDQATEMAVQMKEAKDRCESLEEELTDAHRLMNERGRESETMRRLLTEAETRSDSKLKEMRERVETALQERDNAEAEIATAGRRRGRESELLKARAQSLEHDLKSTEEARKHLETVQRTFRDQNERDARKIENQIQELSEVRHALGELRDLLDRNESQARTLELEKTELKRNAEESQQRLERLQKTHKTMTEELRTLRSSRIRPIESGQQSSRTSAESLQTHRVVSPMSNGREGSPSRIGSDYHSNVDFVYLKNVLFQFLEQKDKSHQLQLIPVLSMLLHFDKKDEQKWMTIVNSR